MVKLAVIIQARMGSTRLPNKVLADIERKPMIWHHINRLNYSKYSPDIIIATTNLNQDKKILELAEQYNIKSFAGSSDDVLDRYYQTAKLYSVDIIIRITADCPLIDPKIFDQVVDLYLEGDCDYASNTRPPTYPDGLDVEGFSFYALEKSWKEAKLTSQREHVTNYITDTGEFKLKNLSYIENLSHLRWTVDEKEDLQFVREIYKYLYPKKKIFLMNDVLKLLEERPELIEINKKYIRNEGYLRSLKKDRIIK